VVGFPLPIDARLTVVEGYHNLHPSTELRNPQYFRIVGISFNADIGSVTTLDVVHTGNLYRQ
jgi:hypothetical protein